MKFLRCAIVALVVPSALGAQQPASYTPPRIVRAEVPALPVATVVGGGEVLIEVVIDGRGLPSRPVLLRSTPPYTQMMLDAIRRWQFVPAVEVDAKGQKTIVEAPVLIAAIYRPPTLHDGPTLGESPTHITTASADVAYPARLIPPRYPVRALGAAAILFEVSLDETGTISDARPLATAPGFETAARDALRQWTFRPALVRGRPAAASAYVLFGFRAPVMSLR